jgi:dolichol-phosphate mannosyltransferase
MMDWEVPTYEATELRPPRSRYCVVIPVINEGKKIHAQLERMRDVSANTDVIIADGGSTDGSMEPERLRALGVGTLLVKTGPGKLSAQMRMAFAHAMKQDYQGLVTIDGNNKDDPSAIPAFIAALEEGQDHVQGSRFIPGGHAENTPLARWLGIRLVHAPLISIASGVRYTDTTNGFRAYSRRLLLDPRVAPFRDVFSTYELHYYLAIRAAKLGFRVKELPVTRVYPASGPVPTKISSVRGNLLVLQTLFAACLSRFDPVVEER